MSIIGETYEILADLKNMVQKKKDQELMNKVLELQLKFYELKEENEKLKLSNEIEDKIERHSDGPYITLRDDPYKIEYCSTCWGTDKSRIQFAHGRCPVCKTYRDKREMKISY